MVPQKVKELLQQRVAKANVNFSHVGGGSINETYKVEIDGQNNLFLKLNSNNRFSKLFEKEKNGLEFLAKQNCIIIPQIILHESDDNYQWLLLEWIETGNRSKSFWKKFGEQLARLHQVTADHFGFFENNYMGALPQSNSFSSNWTEFFISQRLEPQIKLAVVNGLLQKDHVATFDMLFAKLGSLFNDEQPSLLHGDLWSGNYICNDQSLPVLIDPAVYFGHRSIDLGMTTLFGGFDKEFYDSYNYHFPFPPNYEEQWKVCNLYPLLIHLNLFGTDYLREILATLKRLG